MPVDYSQYNPAWAYLRELISHRDGNRCKKCRAPHRVYIWRMKNRSWQPADVTITAPRHVRLTKPIPSNARRLILCVCTVAHLDWDRTNDDPENLALLCQQCHLDHDRPQHLYKRLKSKYRRGGQRELFQVDKPARTPLFPDRSRGCDSVDGCKRKSRERRKPD